MSDTGQAGGRPRVVVLGGGFAGIGAAQKLKGSDVDVVVVDKHDYHTFQPLLYQLATGLLEMTAVGHSLRDLVKNQDNATNHKAPITGIDLDAQEVRFEGLAPITYHYHVFALGASTRSVQDFALSFDATSGSSYGAPRSIHSMMRAMSASGSFLPPSGMCGSLTC